MCGFSNKSHFQIIASVLVFGALTCASPARADFGSCRGGTTVVCGATISLPDTAVGSISNVHIPASVLGDSYAMNANLYFTVGCSADQNGGTSYNINDVDKISCNAFPCQATNVRLCEASIPVKAGTPLGGTVQVAMPLSNGKGTFTVQCLGSLDEPPVYKITEHAGVTCNPAPAP